MYIEGLDELDNKILNVIRNNARLTYSEIGERVETSRVTVKNRIENMEKQGIIQGYNTLISSTNLENGIKFFFDMEVEISEYFNILDRLATNPMIKEIYQITGDNLKIRAVGFTTNSNNIKIYMNNLCRNAEGIKRIACNNVLSTIKDVDGGVDYDLRYKESEHMERGQSFDEKDNQ